MIGCKEKSLNAGGRIRTRDLSVMRRLLDHHYNGPPNGKTILVKATLSMEPSRARCTLKNSNRLLCQLIHNY